MRICLMIEGQEGVSWEQWKALAGACEAAGLDGLFRSDHYLSIVRGGDAGSLDAWATLAALAAVTERIRLGTLVSPVTFRHPAVLGKNAVTVDHVSGGRVELGIGAGWYEAEHDAYGFPFLTARERVGLLREQIETIVRQWTEDDRVWPKPLQQPHPPLIVGGTGKPGTITPAVRWASEYNTHTASVEDCRRRRRALDEACRGAGRDPGTLPLSLMTTTIAAENRSDLRDRVGRFLELTGRQATVEEYLGEPAGGRLVGTLDELAERLGAYEDAGVTRVMCQHLLHDDLEMVSALGRLPT
jgi:alkanesulfonate monooxygenase SsuD/methylene tetrahydromethanopterin reductase-like flavin-dependent oxidoreductase (luciferase family)